MANFANKTRKKLLNVIQQVNEDKVQFLHNPDSDFTRNRKLDFEKVLLMLLCMKGESLKGEICDFFNFSHDMPTASAFVQQRAKIKSSAFSHIFSQFNKTIKPCKKFKGYTLIACDGSDVRIPRNPNDETTFCKNSNGKGYNKLHLNAFYNLLDHTYEDLLVQKSCEHNETKALNTMVDRASFSKKTIIISDRGYECYNSFAHIVENGFKILTRVKDVESSSGILSGFSLPETKEFDVNISINLTRKHSNTVRKNRGKYKYLSKQSKFDYLNNENEFYKMKLRIVRFAINDDEKDDENPDKNPDKNPDDIKYECVITNLNKKQFSPAELKELYHMRWGIETSFRKLKYTIGLSHFHSKKVDSIIQEIFACAIMYNFCEVITCNQIITKKHTKHSYVLNFSFAVKICRHFLKSSHDKVPIDVQALIQKQLLPVRPDRHFNRPLKSIDVVSFSYRVA